MDDFQYDTRWGVHTHRCSDPATIGLASNALDTQAVIRGADIFKQTSRTRVRGHQNVESAIIVDIRVSCASPNVSAGKTQTGTDVAKARVSPYIDSIIVKHQRKLRI